MSKKVLELVAERHELAHEPGLVVAAEEDDLVGVVDEHGAEVEDDLGGEEAAVDIVAEEDVLHGAAAKLLLGLHGVGEAGDPKDGRGGRRRSSPGAAARRGWASRASAAAPATASRRPRRTASSRRAAATGTAPRLRKEWMEPLVVLFDNSTVLKKGPQWHRGRRQGHTRAPCLLVLQ